MRGTAGIFLIRSNKGCQTFWMVRVFVKQRRHKDGGVEEVLHRVFPRTLRSRSSRTRRIVSRTTPAESGAPPCSTQIPCFLRMRALPRAGRRTMRSSELSNSRESPGLSCNSSRTGLGSTSRPVLSRVRMVTTIAILPYHLPFRMLSELRSSIPSGSHADADGRYLTAQRLCSTITSTSHYILRRGFHAGRGRSAIRSASHIRSQYRKMDLAVGRNCLCCGIAFFDLQPTRASRSTEQRSGCEQRANRRADQTYAVG